MQIEQNKIPEPKWVSELMEMELRNNQIKDLQEKWESKCNNESVLGLDKAKKLPLFEKVKSFLEKISSRQYTTVDRHKIYEGAFGPNNQEWVYFSFDADIREWFLNFINYHQLSTNAGFKILKKYFGGNLETTKQVNGYYHINWSEFIGRKSLKSDKQNIDALFDALWSGILKSADINTQDGEKKSYNNLSDQDILMIINAYSTIFDLQKFYEEYKDKLLYPDFINGLSNESQGFIKKLKLEKFIDLETYEPFVKRFWDIYSEKGKDWLVGELDNYFKLELAQRGDSILKKILTDKTVDIKRFLWTNIGEKYSKFGDYIKYYFDQCFGDYSEYIYCTLGEFFGDNEEFFNKVCKEDATRILKYYEKYLLNDLGSDFYNRLKKETELAKDNADNNKINQEFNPTNNELNPRKQNNPQGQEVVNVNINEHDNNINDELNSQKQKIKVIDRDDDQKIANVNGQKENAVDNNFWKILFWISLAITVLLTVGASVACVGFDAPLLWIIAPCIGSIFTVFLGYKMFAFKSKSDYENILPSETKEPESEMDLGLNRDVAEEEKQNGKLKPVKIIVKTGDNKEK